MGRVMVRVRVRVRVSTDCRLYFYIPNTRKVYFTMAKIINTTKLQHYHKKILSNHALMLANKSGKESNFTQ